DRRLGPAPPVPKADRPSCAFHLPGHVENPVHWDTGLPVFDKTPQNAYAILRPLEPGADSHTRSPGQSKPRPGGNGTPGRWGILLLGGHKRSRLEERIGQPRYTGRCIPASRDGIRQEVGKLIMQVRSARSLDHCPCRQKERPKTQLSPIRTAKTPADLLTPTLSGSSVKPFPALAWCRCWRRTCPLPTPAAGAWRR